ncbi:MAG: cyclic nucleotide-binding domain-containing protein [Deltaproteobacteria bacterium]
MVTTLEPILKNHPFCKDLEPHYVQLLVGCASNVVFHAGDIIFRMEDPSDQFFLIRTGKIGVDLFVPVRGHIAVQTLSDGDILGWSWLIPPYRTTFQARAIDTSRALAIDGKCLRKKCESDHDLGYELFKRVAPILVRQLEATQLQLLDLYRTEA